MNTTIRLQKRGIVTIPKKIRNLWKIEEGDFLDVKTEDDKVVLSPSKNMDKEILLSSKKALEELKAKSVPGPFSNMKEFEDYLYHL